MITRAKTGIPLDLRRNKMSYIAGCNLFGGRHVFPGVLGTAFTTVFDLKIARTGLSETETKNYGIQATAVSIKASTRAHYYPGNDEVALKVVSEKSTGKLLGAQCVGREGVIEHINAVAALLYMNVKIRNLFFTDYGYAPPFAPVWDPLVVVSRVSCAYI